MSIKNMFLTRNVGTLDRWLRAIPALLVVWAWWTDLITGYTAIAAAIIAAMLLVTSVCARCSIYYMLGLSSCPTRS